MTGLLVGALLAMTLGGCGAATDDPSDPPGTRTTEAGADVQERLAAGLAATSPNEADLIGRAKTTLTPVEATWLHGWQVFDVLWRGPNHPVRFYAALSDDNTALMLTGSPESFTEMVRDTQVEVDDAAVAVEVGNLSMSEIIWLSAPDPTEEQQRADLEARFGDVVQQPVAVPSDTGWNVTVWMIYDRSLVRHDLQIATDGVVHDNSEVVATDMPLPYSQ